MSASTLAVVGTALLENERRLPIHPSHAEQIPAELRRRMIFERGYGEPLNVSDDTLAGLFGGLASRADLLAEGGIVLIPKMTVEDLAAVREGGVVWGWPHCVQQHDIAQVAIDRKLTLIAWESMHTWRGEGLRDMHLFYRNNEMAGYCGVLHAMALQGRDGGYGRPLRAVVLSFGSVSRGAIHALRGLGLHDVKVYTQRPVWAIHDRVPGCHYGQMISSDDGGPLRARDHDGREQPMIDVLAESDVIVNGILQDTDAPLTFVSGDELSRLRAGSLIVDVSCDLDMGFPGAHPTSFEEPTFRMGPATYYAVNHTPSYLWRSASWELSQVVVPFLPTIMGGPDAWEQNESVRRAIDIRDGVIVDPRILRFQGRAETYPHAVTG